MDWKQRKAIENEYRKKLLQVNPNLTDNSGIYAFLRYEGNFKFAYIGQAKHILTRLVQHCMGHDSHIDKSLKAHKLWNIENPYGWVVSEQYECAVNELDEQEQKFIEMYANNGYQLYNKTIGGQGKGKVALGEYKEPKGYKKGVEYGREKLRKELQEIIDKYLTIGVKKDNKLSQRMLGKFKEIIWQK